MAPRQAEEQNRCLAKQKKYLSVPASLKVQTNQQDTKYPKLLSGLTYLAALVLDSGQNEGYPNTLRQIITSLHMHIYEICRTISTE
jgi:hypothetical protein